MWETDPRFNGIWIVGFLLFTAWTLGRDFLRVYLDVQVSNFNSSQTEFLWPVPKIHLEEGLEGGKENH